MASISTTSTATLFSSLLSKPSFSLFRTLPRITCCLPSTSSSSSSSFQFNISFAPPKPKPTQSPLPRHQPQLQENNDDDCDEFDGPRQLFIPWIVRGEDGNLKLQTHPPARFIHAIAHAKTHERKKKKKNNANIGGAKSVKLSKAARRFYNDNFRDPPERLSKVLAAAGGNINIFFFLNCITIVTLLSMLLTPCKVLVNSHIFLCSQNVHKSDMLMTIKRYLILKVVFKKVFNVET